MAKGGGAPVAEALDRLSSLVATTIGSIDSGLARVKTPPASSENGATHSLGEIVEKLRRYVEESDCESLDYIESVRGDLYALCDRDSVDGLEASIRAYNFKAALDILKLLSARCEKLA